MSPKDTGGAVPKFPKRADFGADARVRQVAETEKYIFTDPSDGMEYEYSEDNSAWFPVWNAQLVEQQQSAYGKAEEAEPAADRGKKRRTERPARARRENTAVYVSGLPKDTTEKEVAEFFAQCGAILPDLLTNEPRVKLYRTKEGELKGDGLVTYFKAASVELAMEILDDSPFRLTDTERIHIEPAQFKEHDAEDDGAKEAPKRPRLDPKLVQKKLSKLERKLDWYEGGEEIAERYKRTVILKHMFTIQELEEDVTLLLDLAEDVREECEKLGTVSSVKVYDKSEEGVISVKFKDELSAKACVKTMNGRFFAGRQVEAATYDGHTRYKSSAKRAAADDDGHDDHDNGNGNGSNGDQERMDKYAEWLESQEAP